jgi:hypothetical protein
LSTFSGGLSGAVIRFSEVPGSGYLSGTTFAIPPVALNCNFTSGTPADNLDGVSAVLLTLAASTPQTLDLTALVDLFGNAITAARARFFYFQLVTPTDGHTVAIGNNGSNDFTGFVSSGGTITLYPSSPLNGGFVLISAPNTTAMVINSTHKNLKFDPGSNAASVLVLIGTASV